MHSKWLAGLRFLVFVAGPLQQNIVMGFVAICSTGHDMMRFFLPPSFGGFYVRLVMFLGSLGLEGCITVTSHHSQQDFQGTHTHTHMWMVKWAVLHTTYGNSIKWLPASWPYSQRFCLLWSASCVP